MPQPEKGDNLNTKRPGTHFLWATDLIFKRLFYNYTV